MISSFARLFHLDKHRAAFERSEALPFTGERGEGLQGFPLTGERGEGLHAGERGEGHSLL